MYKKDLALNNLQRLICQKTQPNQTKPAEMEKIQLSVLNDEPFLFVYFLTCST